MAFNVTLYTFSKRKNSTSKPTGGTVFSGLMREPCGVIRPSVSFEFAAGVNPSAYNYAYIPDFGRYYFIREWTSTGRLWACSMEVDALASWADEIGAQSLYVTRSSKKKNGNISDGLYPILSDYTINKYEIASSYATRIESGWFVVGIINSDADAVGAVSYYVFTPAQFSSFKQSLMTSSTWTGVSDITEELLKTLFNPFQYIASCKWFPYQPPMGADVSSLPFGWWSFSVNCHELSSIVQYQKRRIEIASEYIPKHPQAGSRGDYLNNEPFSEYNLAYSPYGLIRLPGWINIDNTDLIISETIDFITGNSTLLVYATNAAEQKNVAAEVAAPIAIDVQIAQTNVDFTPALKSLGGAIASAASLDFRGALADAASGIASAVCAAPTVQTGGRNGGFSDLVIYDAYITLHCKFYHVADNSNRLLGAPLCEDVTLSTIPGYIEVLSPHINIACTAEETEMIEAYMQSGFFLDSGVD